MLKSITIQISALDRLTAPARKMQDTLNRLGEPLRKVNQAVGRMGDATGVTKLTGKFRALGHQLTDVRDRLGGVLGSLAGMAGLSLAGAGGGLLAGVIKTSAEFEKYETVLTTITGSSAKAKAALAWISDFAQRTPYELGETTDAFVRLRAYGMNPMDGTLRTLGDAAAATGKRLDDAVEMIADAAMGEFERLKSFNIKTSTKGDIVTFMFTDKDQRKRTFQAAKNDARALQKVVLDAFQAMGYSGAMDNLSRTWNGMVSNMKDSFARFMLAIGSAGIFDHLKSRMAGLLGLLDRASKDGRLQAWAKRISDEMIRLAQAVEGFIRSIDWGKTWQGIKDFASGVQAVVNAVGGWKNAIIGLMILLNAGLIVSLVELGVMLVGIAPAIAGVGMSLGALAFGPIIAAVGNFITALRAGYSAVAAFNLVLAANPIVLVVMAVAALAAAAFLVVKNWDSIKAWFGGLWAWIAGAASAGIQAVVQALKNLDLFQVGAEVFGRLWEGFKAKWAEVTAWFAGAVRGLVAWLPDWAKGKLGLTAPAAPQPAHVRSIANPPAMRRVAAATAAAGALALPTALAASPAITAAARPAGMAAQRQAPAAAAALQPASVTQQVHAPVQVAVTINGLADVAVVHRAVDDAVRTAIRDWEDRQARNERVALYDS